jgi:autotransporter translocation and assembly factor TamB
MALLRIYRQSGARASGAGGQVAGNIVQTRGKAITSRAARVCGYRLRMNGCNIDTQDPLGVLAVEAAKQGRFDIFPFAVY